MTREDAPTAQALSERSDAYPVVPVAPQGNWGPIAFAVVLAAGGALLFSALSANRQAVQAPRTTATLGSADSQISAPPPLALPPGFAETDYRPVRNRPYSSAAIPTEIGTRETSPRPVVVRSTGSPSPVEPSYYVPPPLPFEGADPAANRLPGPFEATASQNAAGVGGAPFMGNGDGTDRAMAARLANPSRTVPRGTVIPAVLETALDSTRPGAARGLVQRDVHSFDGTRVLIPRGSRLYGEYGADLGGGQRRAAIQWTRLLRPDGVTIELDSPAADPLGRAGVSGRVDSKFFQRFGGAILQSVLDIGVGVATRKASDGVIVALPGSTQNLRVNDQQQIQPTLKVRQGSSVSVFVARDLDFSTVDP